MAGDRQKAEINENQGFFTTTLDVVAGWARKNSLWPLPFGTACCAIEYMSALSSHYDVSRFGAEAVRFSPRQSDLMVVAGTVTDKMGPVMEKIYAQMLEPKWVIAMGVCASSGGFYRAYHVMQGIDERIPVDVYVPGCPPTPEGFIHALMKIQEIAAAGKIARPRRGFMLDVNQKMKQMQGDFPTELPRWRGEATSPSGDLTEKQDELLAALKGRLESDFLFAADFRGDLAVGIKKERLIETARWLKEDQKFDMLVDITAVDYLGRSPRFEAVHHFYSTERKRRLRLKCPLEETDLSIDSLIPLWRGANWFEREVWDMFGVAFAGHPNYDERILTHKDFKGHPLRRDYDPTRRHELKESVGPAG